MATIIKTEDGSNSIQSAQFEATYHSIHGAIQETQTVFIEAALKHKATTQNELSILEIGFGTGLNAFMTYLEALKLELQIHYTGVEAYPISEAIAKQLNYAELLNAQDKEQQFLNMHAQTNEWLECAPNFKFYKQVGQFEDITAQNQFDIIYYDAFAPSVQPELWETTMLTQMYQALKPKGVLTTYCAKGVFKRRLKEIGFDIEAIPGPIGKREMTRATKK
ncbi:tRNA (5-methylaminomethyl-2-thiouridine)(34)-methyltransferase MnmD [Aureispira sp. CCB-E]|uniref:tRNA (5-methylaminomethyl-2-thiouridine)(34)-methyltransferase MnmD n=1 Tax=Aureispira sp. CCB-E TaxID=3051121 RepID=UPI0028695E91|nr:tRNA (5-methylaminomethyl-2-thiouridine)(34)-methyltransferase MnmD [Aureispira sp. CCB-E]WMX13680.1 tRNA (5-methylaminomethyl-2-thiouridine)(34)-methyltransferase MnmD [Aureispira sp. CCB-E]